ncbi:porin family protein [Marinobacter sp. HN1S83]|uniref:porin family protein n=1 Tax=Marinobacter sp. HN1S83 TaxID=3382301 RepID=UPI00387B2CB6
MELSKKIGLIALGCAFTLNAHAASPWENRIYVSGGVGYNTFDVDDELEFDTYGLTGKFGIRFTPYLGVETRLAVGVTEDSWTIPDGTTLSGDYKDIDVTHEYSIGQYVVLGYANESSFYPYVSLGYAASGGKLELNPVTKENRNDEAPKVSESLDDSDFSYAFGFNLVIQQDLAVTAEYISYLDTDDADLSGFSVGLTRQF